jgi:hypothetical protein
MAFCFGFTGAFLLLLVAPFSVIPGYYLAGTIFAAAGLLLLAIAWRLKLSRGGFYAAVGINLLLTLFLFGLTARGVGYAVSNSHDSVAGVVTIDDAVSVCRATGLSGWDLVAYAQNLTAKKFVYSLKNPWDTPAGSFAHGEGYCMQQAVALKQILDRLGISNRVVYAARCQFADEWVDGKLIYVQHVAGHAWVRVSLGGRELDVCSGDVTNTPGANDFTALSKVISLNQFTEPLMQISTVVGVAFGSPVG